MAEFVKVAKKSEIENGKMKAFTVNRKQITVANVDGEYLAFDDECSHAKCSLAGSVLDDHTVTCYCHGGQFNVKTGEVLAPPPISPISIYQIKVEGEDIFIEI